MRRHFDQAAVGKDHVGRLLLRLGQRAAHAFSSSSRSASTSRAPPAGPRLALGLGDDVLAQRERRLAVQHLAPLLGDDDAVAVVAVAVDQPRRHQLPEHAAPLRARVGADAERLELVVAVARHRFGRPAPRGCWRDGRRRTAPMCASPPTAPFAPRALPSTSSHRALQTSQLPHGAESSPNTASSVWRRHRAVSHRATRSSSLAGSTALRSSGAPPRRSGGGAARCHRRHRARAFPPAGRRGRRGRSPGNRIRSRTACRRAARSARPGLSTPMPKAMVAQMMMPSS